MILMKILTIISLYHRNNIHIASSFQLISPLAGSTFSTSCVRRNRPIVKKNMSSDSNNNSYNDNDSDKDGSSWSIQDQNDIKTIKSTLHVWPLDEYNLKLLNEVHPKNWSNSNKKPKLAIETHTQQNESAPEEDDIAVYDFIAIGAGAGGLVSSRQAARRGAKSAMISSNLAGGDCLNVGCVPSKALIRSARLIREVRNAQLHNDHNNKNNEEGFGVKIDGTIEIDFPQIMKRMRKLRSDIAPIDGHERGEEIGVDVYQGFGRFVSGDTIEVVPVGSNNNGQPIQMKFNKLAICTGGRASVPSNIPGLDKAPYTTNETLFNLTRLPKRMIVLGSGVVALEMAQTFAAFGADVTVLVRSEQLFPRSDPDAGPLLMDLLTKNDDVQFITNSKVTSVETLRDVEEGEEDNLPLMKISIDASGKKLQLECECLLVATGRTPNIENLNLDEANVAFDSRRGILVDDNARSTTNPNIYSVGDCTADVPRLTHMSGEMAKVVVQNSLFDDDWKLSSLVIPSCMYTEPEFATVGDVSASSDDDNVDIYMASFDHNDRSILDSDREGYVKVFCKKGTGIIVGCSIISARAGELINEATLAIKYGIPLEGIGRNIHCYPTTGESLMSCGIQFINSKWKRFDSK